MWLVATLVLAAVTGACYSLYLMQMDRERRVARLIARLERADALLALDDSADDSLLQRLTRTLSARLRPLMPRAMVAAVRERLLWAGRPYGLTVDQFFALKFGLALLLPSVLPLVTAMPLGLLTTTVLAAAAVTGYTLPDFWINGLINEHRRQAQRELPLFTDLIATTLEAGLSLPEAVRRIAYDAPGLVAGEFLRTIQEMAAGKPRQQAWRDLMNRVPGDSFRTIVSAIMQAEQYGTSVAEILRYQISQMRLFKQALCRCTIESEGGFIYARIRCRRRGRFLGRRLLEVHRWRGGRRPAAPHGPAPRALHAGRYSVLQFSPGASIWAYTAGIMLGALPLGIYLQRQANRH